VSTARERVAAFVDVVKKDKYKKYNNACSGDQCMQINDLRELLAGYIDPQYHPTIRAALNHVQHCPDWDLNADDTAALVAIDTALAALPPEEKV